VEVVWTVRSVAMDLGSSKAQGAFSAWGTEGINSLTRLAMSPKI
jgi:hypothetical protein